METMHDYLERLPNGIDSYPDCQMKASFLQEKFSSPPVPFDRARLPPVLQNLLNNPPPASVFVPTVHMFALNHALLDAMGGDEDAFERHTVDANRRQLTSPLYRAMFLFVSPKNLINNADARWGKVHRGVTLSSEVTGERSFRGSLTFPEHLAFPLLLTMWAAIFKLGIELAGAKNVKSEVGTVTSTHGTIFGEWD